MQSSGYDNFSFFFFDIKMGYVLRLILKTPITKLAMIPISNKRNDEWVDAYLSWRIYLAEDIQSNYAESKDYITCMNKQVSIMRVLDDMLQ